MFIINISKLLFDELEIVKKVIDYNICIFVFFGFIEKKLIIFFFCFYGYMRNIFCDGREDYVVGCNL